MPRNQRRKGITPVIAIVLLLLVTVGAVGAVFASVSGIIGSSGNAAEDAADFGGDLKEVSVLSCYRNGSETVVSMQNSGPQPVNISRMTMRSRGLKLTLDKGDNLIETDDTKHIAVDEQIQKNDEIKIFSGESRIVHACTALRKDPCPDGMAHIETERTRNFCIFKYEASRSDATSTSQGSSNVAASQQGVATWHGLRKSQAANACERAGYRLPTNLEWQEATGAVPGKPSTHVHGNNEPGTLRAVENTSESCTQDPTNTVKDRCLTGTGPETWETYEGVEDLNGNVEEIVATSKGEEGVTDSRLPGSPGHITGWSSRYAVPTSVGSADPDFSSDRFSSGSSLILRGGDWAHGEGAGAFKVKISGANDDGPDIGFRCVDTATS